MFWLLSVAGPDVFENSQTITSGHYRQNGLPGANTWVRMCWCCVFVLVVREGAQPACLDLSLLPLVSRLTRVSVGILEVWYMQYVDGGDPQVTSHFESKSLDYWLIVSPSLDVSCCVPVY